MLNSEARSCQSETNRHIDAIIDARKKCGDYDVCSRSDYAVKLNYLCAPNSNEEDRYVRFDDAIVWNGDLDASYNTIFSMRPTDSEITVVRVKREGLQLKRRCTSWDMHDEAVPGDGTHLGESPSLVNLVTLVGHTLQPFQVSNFEMNEYLVPLSSWDPSDKPHEYPEMEEECGISGGNGCDAVGQSRIHRRPSLAGKITRFIKKHCSAKSKPSQSGIENNLPVMKN